MVSLDQTFTALLLATCCFISGWEVVLRCIRLWSDSPSQGRDEELYAPVTLTYKKSRILFSLIAQSTYCLKLVRTGGRETWLKSPLIIMRVLGCRLCDCHSGAMTMKCENSCGRYYGLNPTTISSAQPSVYVTTLACGVV